MRNTWLRIPSEIVNTTTVKDAMFSKLTSILTMTALLLHAVLGCCVHHSHACEHGSSGEECQAEHVEHHSKQAEIGHAGHPAEGHAGCSSHCDHDSRYDTGVTQVAANDEHDSSSHPQGPCQQNCDGRDCRFTQSPEVKTPSRNDGRLCCPSTSAAASIAESCRFEFEHFAAESRPPRALMPGCCRPMTQVWRL